jgi:transcriptional antiterminator RfaH
LAHIPDGTVEPRWYVVQTRPNCESRAIFHLERQGYRIFCPRVVRTVRHARKTRRVLAPLFPNYLFTQMDVAYEPWRHVNSTCGVSRLIARGDVPQPVARGVVEALQERIAEDGAVDWKLSFKLGQQVQIAEGCFADFVGTLEHLDGSGRARVLLDLLGRSVSVTLCGEALLAAA